MMIYKGRILSTWKTKRLEIGHRYVPEYTIPEVVKSITETRWQNVWTLYFRMDELGFYIPSTVFQSFRDNGRVKESPALNTRHDLNDRICSPEYSIENRMKKFQLVQKL